MQAAALLIIGGSALYLIGVGVLMIIRPARFLQLLALTASSWRVNTAEQGLRLLAGLAMLLRADSSKLPDAFEIGGWFIVVSSLVLLITPLRWHAGYAIWWSRRMSQTVVRTIGPFSAALGMGVAYAAW